MTHAQLRTFIVKQATAGGYINIFGPIFLAMADTLFHNAPLALGEWPRVTQGDREARAPVSRG